MFFTGLIGWGLTLFEAFDPNGLVPVAPHVPVNPLRASVVCSRVVRSRGQR